MGPTTAERQRKPIRTIDDINLGRLHEVIPSPITACRMQIDSSPLTRS